MSAETDLSSAASPGLGHVLDELTSFLYELRDAGYGIGLHQFLAVQELLLALAAGGGLRDAARLRSLIGPLVAKTPAQQADFAARFDRWAAGRKIEIAGAIPSEAPTGAASEVHRLTAKLRWWRRSMAAAAVLIVAISMWALVRPSPLPPRRLAIAGDGQNPSTKPVSTTEPVTSRAIVPVSPNRPFVDPHAPIKPIVSDPPKPDSPKAPPFASPSPPPKPGVSAGGTDASFNSDTQVVSFIIPGKDAPRTDSFRLLYEASVVIWGAGALVLMGAAYATWWQFQTRRFLTKRAVAGGTHSSFLVVDYPHASLYRGPTMTSATLRLALHRRREGGDPDIDATLTQYGRTGMLLPVQSTIRVSPEYLFLVDRAAPADQQAKLSDQLVEHLKQRGLFVEQYWFQGDPRLCIGEQSRGRLYRLADLAAYTGYCLVICGDGDGLIDPLSGNPFSWVQQFATWPRRALLTPHPPDEWGQREGALASAGFLILPATDAGLLALAHYLNDSKEQLLPSCERYLPLPETLLDNPGPWLAHHPPPAADVNRVLAGLRAALGDGGYYWFSACAVYPEVQWDLTLYFGTQLRDEDGRPLLNESTLAQLVRLPWFRRGMMPNWLRVRLIRDLPATRDGELRRALAALMLSAVRKSAGGIVLEIAQEDRPTFSALTRRVVRLLRRQAPPESPVRERVFASFMADDLRVRIPRLVIPLLRSMRRVSRRKIALFVTLAAIAVVAVFFVRRILRRDEIVRSHLISSAHSLWLNDCTVCHDGNGKAPGLMPSEVSDAACLRCHSGGGHHPNQLQRVGPNEDNELALAFVLGGELRSARCTVCHIEHQGKESLSAVANETCTKCHANIAAAANDPRMVKVPNVTAFNDEGGHPYFGRELSGGKRLPPPQRGKPNPMTLIDHTVLYYSHSMQAHLSIPPEPGTAENCTRCHVNHSRETLDDLRSAAVANPWTAQHPDPSTRPIFSIRQPTGGDAEGVYRGEEGPGGGQFAPWAKGDGRYMRPVSFARDCEYCHRLDPSGSDEALLPHVSLDLVLAQIIPVRGEGPKLENFYRN